MAKVKFGSAGVTATEIDRSGPAAQSPSGIPAGVIGTSNRGPAFVPITVGNIGDFYAKFGSTDAKKFGPLAASEWLRNAQSLTYLRVLGVGDGLKRDSTTGKVTNAGFVVGEQLPNDSGELTSNPYAYAGGPQGRTFFLGAMMSGTSGQSSLLTEGFNSAASLPILRGILMAPSGVVITLSSSLASSSVASSNAAVPSGSTVGNVSLYSDGVTPSQNFVLLLNGHKGTVSYPNVVTASFLTSSGGNYFASKLNKDPYKLQEAGHYLHSYWDFTGFVVTGSGVLSSSMTASSSNGWVEPVAFILTGSAARAAGTTGKPNYESFEDRFSPAKSPWVISQKFGGKPANLFRFHALDDGAGFSTNYKISIENITLSGDPRNQYGSFDVLIREWNDTDSDKKIVERFSGLSLDPSADTYIAKAIGDLKVYYDFDRNETDQKLVVEGDYSNISRYVRVEMSDEVVEGLVDPAALPMGFRGIYHTVTSGSALNTAASYPITSSATQTLSAYLSGAVEPPLPFNVSIYKGASNKRLADANQYWGVAFQNLLGTSDAGTQLGKVMNGSVKSYAGFLPSFRTDATNFFVGDNTGEADGLNGVVDADRFNYNMFTLENVAVYTSSLTPNAADSQRWAEAEYHRTGGSGSLHRNFKVTDLTTENRRFAKFTFFMQGGFDGVNIFDPEESTLSNAAVDADMAYTARGTNNGPNVRAYAKALDVMKNTVNADIQLLAVPGIRNEFITNKATADVEQRFDAMFLMDIPSYDLNALQVTSSVQQVSVSTTAQAFANRAINSSFAAAYFPDVSMIDPTLNVAVDVPPSVAVLGALALNDAVGHPWFAPAGFTRGSLPTTLETKVKLSKLNQDILYDTNINPLVQFTTNPVAGTGPTGNVVVWGQKTLLQSASALDRVNVRRLLIEIRRQVRDIAQTILFEPNRATTLARFSAAITPRLQRIQQLAGLERFKVVIDSSTTTQQDIENNTIRGKIFVQPTRTVEFVSLDFVVANNIQQ